MTVRKFHYYRAWHGDSNNRWEITTLGPIKAIDIDHAIAQVKKAYVGKEYLHLWEDTGKGDDQLAILECTDWQHFDDCPMSADPEADCDCEPHADYIQIEEIE